MGQTYKHPIRGWDKHLQMEVKITGEYDDSYRIEYVRNGFKNDVGTYKSHVDLLEPVPPQEKSFMGYIIAFFISIVLVLVGVVRRWWK